MLKVSSPPRAERPNYVSNPVDIFLTTANLRGVPYGFKFAGQQTAYMHKMTAFADNVHFRLAWPNEKPPAGSEETEDAAPIMLDATRIEVTANNEWSKLTKSALASGAFPLGLAPQPLIRKAIDYDGRLWPIAESKPLTTEPDPDGTPAPACHCSKLRPIVPLWPDGIRLADPDPTKTGADPSYEYDYWNVDGGLMNNEPLELVRRVLADGGRNPRDGEEADRAVVMIDPFPNGSDVEREIRVRPRSDQDRHAHVRRAQGTGALQAGRARARRRGPGLQPLRRLADLYRPGRQDDRSCHGQRDHGRLRRIFRRAVPAP